MNESKSIEIRVVYITAANKEEARLIGRDLVESGLAACVNIINSVTSIYCWDGKLCEDDEVVLIAKSTANLHERLIERVTALHSYDCPCIISLPVAAGAQPFLDWIAGQVQ